MVVQCRGTSDSRCKKMFLQIVLYGHSQKQYHIFVFCGTIVKTVI